MASAVITAQPFAAAPPPVHASRQAAIAVFLSGDGRGAESYDDSWAAAPPAEASLVKVKGPERALG
jgi:hypothetical protein